MRFQKVKEIAYILKYLDSYQGMIVDKSKWNGKAYYLSLPNPFYVGVTGRERAASYF
ncbi:MAG: hypothetical protein WBF33_29570 [Candidatus Nitrosopolaris sp.]